MSAAMARKISSETAEAMAKRRRFARVVITGELDQEHHARVGAREAAGFVVEVRQLRREIDVKEFRAGRAGKADRFLHELFADAAALEVGMDGGVEEEGVQPAVAGDVDEADQAFFVIRAD